jgi:hypothetical protein
VFEWQNNALPGRNGIIPKLLHLWRKNGPP